MNPLRHARAVLALPFTMAVVVPALVLGATGGYAPRWPAGAARIAVGALGAALVVAGVALAAWTVGLFGTVGRGTLAPWDPPTRLVVAGPYRHVRNPMLTGVQAVLWGEALAWGAPALAVWAAAFTALNAVYIPLREEPGLRARFGAAYERYARHVPRWLPRRTPWTDDGPG